MRISDWSSDVCSSDLPFFQVETGPVRKYGGTGLGTSIALAHVRRMGGELQLESEPGEGSRFWFELRLARASAQADAQAAPTKRMVVGKRILEIGRAHD